MTNSTPKYIRLSNELWQKLSKEAKKENRSVANLIETILLEWVKNNKEFRK